MEGWRKDARHEPIIVDLEALVPKDHLLRKKVYDAVTSKFDVQFVAMDAGYKTPWIAKKTLDDGKVPVLPYKGRKGGYRPWDYKYDPAEEKH